jgi:hypothetical protein
MLLSCSNLLQLHQMSRCLMYELLPTMKTVILVIAILITVSCTREDQGNLMPVFLEHGTYKGNFTRFDPKADSQTSDVTLILDRHTFSGSSSVARYPEICRGSYKVTGSTIEFADECIHTAEFDWTLILHGTYKVRYVGDRVSLTREYDDGVRDVYTLSLQ